jgi:micrococcal nuclease
VAAAVAAASGCATAPDDGKREPRADRSRDRPAEARTSAGGSFPRPERTVPARVAGVSDGDTLELSGIGKVRLIGVDTPEVYGGAECYGAAASGFTKSVLTPGRRVRYRLGTEERDRYGRALAYLWLRDGTFFNGLLVERGYAAPLTIPPNDDYADDFVRAARRARRAERGLWSSRACARENAPAIRGEPTSGCGVYATQREAQRGWERAGRPYGLDGDGDGRVCEDLP